MPEIVMHAGYWLREKITNIPRQYSFPSLQYSIAGYQATSFQLPQQQQAGGLQHFFSSKTDLIL